jgi:hypothetical protein
MDRSPVGIQAHTGDPQGGAREIRWRRDRWMRRRNAEDGDAATASGRNTVEASGVETGVDEKNTGGQMNKIDNY